MHSLRTVVPRISLALCLPLVACNDSSGNGSETDPGTTAGSVSNSDPTGVTPTMAGPTTADTPTTSASTLGTDTATGTETSPDPTAATDPTATDPTAATDSTDGSVSDTTATQGTMGTDTGDGVLDINPKDITLEIIDGVIVTQAYTATYNGVDVTPNVAWSYNKPEIGEIQLNAEFMPTGNFGGTGQLKATYQAAEAETNVSVKIIKKIDPGGVEPGWGNPVGPDPSMTIVYPYNETVFPLKVAAPVVQWNNVQNGDQYKLHISEQFYDYTIYFSTNTPARHLIDAAEWIAISESGQGAQSDPINFELQRKSGNNVYESVKQTWRMAQARLPGRVYYWELPGNCGGNANGRVLSIKPSEAQANEFFQPGFCWGCHTVSRDGRTVATVADNGNSPFPAFTIDVSVDPAVQGSIAPQPGRGGTFSAFNHDGTKLLLSNNAWNNANTSVLQILDAMNGQVLNPNVLQAGCGEPAWSPDGTKIAATCGYTNGGWTFDASNADLVVADVNPDGLTVSNQKTIVPKGVEAGRPAYPNFSPGNEWLVFGRPTSGARSTGNGKLYLVGVEGNDLVTLDKASSDNKSFNPTFAPLRAGGYFWVVFMSRRDYGNTLVGANRQQLWMTAINDPPNAGGDPSNPPFYVRGQEDCALSENAYFAPDPCIEEPNKPCESGIDCCSGHCIQMGELKVCGEKGACSEAGNACESDADCCDPGTPCIDGYCEQVFPQ
ncbi:hypothetical protein [Nannocystis sp. SCPEA4]|uniref:hypothetical protein n=1 Tax=Nannocystis sp. SCPEA4 TaxID=2996787 RepID=UPI00227226F0|nr:hypothetical protein [Nannocystis sp. SCPEA4]MCY1055278.1 hypothetical protein [Nannocystis sp. SCPEA4]